MNNKDLMLKEKNIGPFPQGDYKQQNNSDMVKNTSDL